MVFKVSIISFLIIVYTVINLFFRSFATSINAGHSLLGSVKFAILMLLVYEMKNEWRKKVGIEREIILKEKFSYRVIISITGVVTGALLTFLLSNEFRVQEVMASTVVGLLGVVLIPKYQIPIYCGSFVGMTSIDVLSDYKTVVTAAVIAGILLVGSMHIFHGFGGKLGVAAFFGTMSSIIIFGKLEPGTTMLGIEVNYFIILYFILGAIFTFMINDRKKIGIVASSSIIGLLGAVILPELHGEIGNFYSIAGFCGTFIGMSSIERIKKYRYMVAAGVFGAVIFVYTSSSYLGLGGKLGVIAFGSTVAMAGLIDIERNIFTYKNEKL